MPFTEENERELDEKGYTIVKQVLNEYEVLEAQSMFRSWQSTIPNHDFVVKHVNSHGIYKFHEVGHQRHAWYIRTKPAVQDAFKKVWKTDELVVSFDGACYMPRDLQYEDKCWMHCDQGPTKVGRQCVQGLVSLTSNKQRTIVMYEGTHQVHEEYCMSRDLISKQTSDWVPIDKYAREEIAELDIKRVLSVDAGDMVLWDSRTFHENQTGPVYEDPDDVNAEERIVQYVCFLPKDGEGNTEVMRTLRQHYFDERRTTNHYPYPMNAVPRQPVFYGPEQYKIDYDVLKKPYLEDMEEEIRKVL